MTLTVAFLNFLIISIKVVINTLLFGLLFSCFNIVLGVPLSFLIALLHQIWTQKGYEEIDANFRLHSWLNKLGVESLSENSVCLYINAFMWLSPFLIAVISTHFIEINYPVIYVEEILINFF